MHNLRLPGSHPRALVVLVSALLAWASIATVASAAADKTFSATVGPNPLVAGGTYSVFPRTPIVLFLTNTSNQAQLGSANVAVPAGLTATALSSSVGSATLNGSVIELRNLDLQPGGLVNVLVSTRVECAANHAPYTWAFQVKQANDFNGTPGNNLVGTNPTSSVTGNCQLTFSKQPAHSEKSPTIITSKIYDPAGAAVTVSVLDGEGIQTVSWWSGTVTLTLGDNPGGLGTILDGTLSGSPTDGSVPFAPTIDKSATGYSLIATAVPTLGTPSVGTNTVGLESANFNIVDDAKICGVNATDCFATAGKGQKTEATVQATSAGAAGDLVILSINDPTETIPACPGYTTQTSDLVIFNVTDSEGTNSSGRSKTTTLTLAAGSVNKSASKYQVCYDSGSGGVLLPTCTNKTPPSKPCVLSKAIDNQTKNLVIVVRSPPGDPKLYF